MTASTSYTFNANLISSTGHVKFLSENSIAWEIGERDNLYLDRVRSETFEIPSLKSTCWFGIFATKTHVDIFIVGLRPKLQLNIEISFIDASVNYNSSNSESNDDNHNEARKFYAVKKRSTNVCLRKPTPLLKMSKDKIKKILKHTRNVEFRCKLNNSANDCDKEEARMIQALDQFESLVDNAEFSDIKFVVEGKVLYAHKSILTARCSVFSAMLQHQMQEAEQSVINIEDMSYDVLKAMLRYVYSCKFDCDEKITKELLAAADKYDLTKLKEACEDELCDKLTVANAIQCLGLAYLHNTKNLEKAALDFIAENGKEIIDEPAFSQLTHLNSELILKLIRHLILHNK